MLKLSRREEDFESLHFKRNQAYFSQLLSSVRHCDHEHLSTLLRNYIKESLSSDEIAQLLGEVSCPRTLAVLLDYINMIDLKYNIPYFPQYVLLDYIKNKYYNPDTLQLVLMGFRRGIKSDVSNILSSLLTAAVNNKDYFALDAIVDEFDLEENSYFFLSALNEAGQNNDFKILKYIIEKFDVDVRSLSEEYYHVFLPITSAIRNENIEMVNYLLDRGVVVDRDLYVGLFDLAALKNDYSIIDTLYKRDLTKLNILLYEAAISNHFEIIDYLLDKYNIDLSTPEFQNTSEFQENQDIEAVFNIAVSEGKERTVKNILEHGYTPKRNYKKR